MLAVYPDHDSAEDAVKLLQKNGMRMDQLSIVGQDFKTIEKPIGFLTTGSVACDGARVGAWTGGLFGILVGAAFLIVPGVGPLVIVGPLAATLLGGVEGAIERDEFPVELMLHHAERVFEDVVKLNARAGGRRGAAELQELSHDVVHAAHFASDDLGEFGVLVFLEQQINERFHGHERVLDLVRHAGG